MATEHVEKPRVFASALVCETTIREKTDILTAVRVTNAYALNPVKYTPLLADGTPDEQNVLSFYQPFTTTLVVIFCAEQPTHFVVDIAVVPPDGKRRNLSPSSISCDIISPGATHTLNIQGRIGIEVAGIFWYEIYVDGQLATKTPMVVRLNSAESAEPPDQELEPLESLQEEKFPAAHDEKPGS
jgi:hypothetical protein